jgi:hypothetical protein
MKKVMPELNPFRTISKKGEKWEENIEYHDIYNWGATDAVVFLVSSWGMDNEEFEKMTKFLDAVTGYDSMRYEWNYRDQAAIDVEDNCAYIDPVYGEVDYITGDEGQIIGRRVIENEEVIWEDIEHLFLDDHTRALPSWYPYDQLFGAGYEDVSCEFEHGMYGRADKPEEIARNMYDRGYTHAVFQLKSVDQFAVKFCIWGKKDD